MISTPFRRQAAGFAWILFILSFSFTSGHAQTRQGGSYPAGGDLSRQGRRWQIGGFFAGGFAPLYSIHSAAASNNRSLDFYNAGLQGGVMISKDHGPGLLKGRAEAAAEVVPFWEASYPKETVVVQFRNPASGNPTSELLSFKRYGATITPLLLRWNFTPEAHPRVMPWVQLGGGLLWTNHKFPIGSSTSVINFTPQAGIGTSIFLRKRQSLDFAVKAVHISSAGLGDHNPGINATLQFSAGYSWWK